MENYPDFMNVNLDEAQEYGTLSTEELAKEQLLRIERVKTYPESFMVQVMCSLPNHAGEFLKLVKVPLFYPKPDDDSEKRNNKLLRLKSFFAAFSMPSNTPPEAYIGKEAFAILKESEDPIYGTSNEVKTFVVNK